MGQFHQVLPCVLGKKPFFTDTSLGLQPRVVVTCSNVHLEVFHSVHIPRPACPTTGVVQWLPLPDQPCTARDLYRCTALCFRRGGWQWSRPSRSGTGMLQTARQTDLQILSRSKIGLQSVYQGLDIHLGTNMQGDRCNAACGLLEWLGAVGSGSIRCCRQVLSMPHVISILRG